LQQAGVLPEYIAQSVTVGRDGGELRPIMALCREKKVAIVLGISERVEGGCTIFNSQVFIDRDGTLLGTHRKLQPTYIERAVWAQGSGHTLSVYPSSVGRIGGLACWENTMNVARQSLIEDVEEIHAGVWPALSTMAGFEASANAQIEALMKNHALTAQVFVVCASNYVDQACLKWMENHLGEQTLIKAGGGFSAIIHPFCTYLAGPESGTGDRLVCAEIDLSQLEGVKVWIDSNGHYKRPEILRSSVDRTPHWADDEVAKRGAKLDGRRGVAEVAVEAKMA
jgi:nitrilase